MEIAHPFWANIQNNRRMRHSDDQTVFAFQDKINPLQQFVMIYDLWPDLKENRKYTSIWSVHVAKSKEYINKDKYIERFCFEVQWKKKQALFLC